MVDWEDEKFASWVEMDAPMELIDPSPLGRTSSEGLADLAQSMKERGLFNRILLRPVGSRLQLIGGHRRWEAALQLGWKVIPARIKRMSDNEAMDLSMIDNKQRDTHPIEMSKDYKTERVLRAVADADVTIIKWFRGKTGRVTSFLAHRFRLPAKGK